MPIQQRSKSTPQLAIPLITEDNAIAYRRQQSFVFPQNLSPSTSRPRGEPFALSGFFPSYLSPSGVNGEGEKWEWLRGDEEMEVESVYTTSEEDPTLPPTPAEGGECENLDRVIQREDKLGILRLLQFLQDWESSGPQPPRSQPRIIEAPSKLLYLEQNVDSFEDMYDTFRARRQARHGDPCLSTNTEEIAQSFSTSPLFSPVCEGADEAEEDWDDVLFRGWQRVTNLLF